MAEFINAEQNIEQEDVVSKSEMEDDIDDNQESDGTNKFSTAYEKETIINFNNAEQTASYYTLNIHKRQMLLDLAEEYPDDVKIIMKTDDSIEAVFPKKWVKIRPPRKMTEEQHAKAVERGKALASKFQRKKSADE